MKYEDIKALIEEDEDGNMIIVCRETDSSWIDTSYVVTAEMLSTHYDIDAFQFAYPDSENEMEDEAEVIVWRVDDPYDAEFARTKEEAIDLMIDMADLYFSAEEEEEAKNQKIVDDLNGYIAAITTNNSQMCGWDVIAVAKTQEEMQKEVATACGIIQRPGDAYTDIYAETRWKNLCYISIERAIRGFDISPEEIREAVIRK